MDEERKRTKITIDISAVAAQLNAVAGFTPNEFSGVGFGVWSEDLLTYKVYRVEVLDIGTWGWTEFSGKDLKYLLTDPDLKNMHLWFHRHPMGSAVPGPQNWSGTDHNTCRNEPLGAVFPPAPGTWSCSIVLTPGGWTGRVDEYGPGKGTHYVDVTPNFVDKHLDALLALKERGKRRRGGSEIGGNPFGEGGGEWDEDDTEYVDELEFADTDAVEEYFNDEPDDGPFHMWLETYIETRNI